VAEGGLRGRGGARSQRRPAPLAGVPGAEVGEASWLVALQLWFVPVYLLLAALTPALLAGAGVGPFEVDTVGRGCWPGPAYGGASGDYTPR
jgi:hypothetical protein